jgi:hypothetical protein
MTKIKHIVITIKFKIADGNNKDKGNNAINNKRIKSILLFSSLKILLNKLSIDRLCFCLKQLSVSIL